jgi:hypothetical protein
MSAVHMHRQAQEVADLLAALRDLLGAIENAEISQPGWPAEMREARARARALVAAHGPQS